MIGIYGVIKKKNTEKKKKDKVGPPNLLVKILSTFWYNFQKNLA